MAARIFCVPVAGRVPPAPFARWRQVFERAGGVVDVHPYEPDIILGLRGPIAAFEALWPLVKRPEDSSFWDEVRRSLEED